MINWTCYNTTIIVEEIISVSIKIFIIEHQKVTIATIIFQILVILCFEEVQQMFIEGFLIILICKKLIF